MIRHMIRQLNKENKKEIILGIDHNLDLLKSMVHKDTQDFLDINFNENLLPCITILDYITVDNIDYYGTKDISNHLGKYYSELGLQLANNTSNNKISYNHYQLN